MWPVVEDRIASRDKARTQELCIKIRDHWAARGHQGVKVWVMPITRGESGKMPVYGIRSNMKSGMPITMKGMPIRG